MHRVQGYSVSGTATIAINTAESTAIDLKGYAQAGFILPAAFTGATVSFKVSADGDTYGALYDAANALISITVTQARAYAFPIAVFPFRFVTILSASNETAARSIIIASKY